jgi:hypothetical protein
MKKLFAFGIGCYKYVWSHCLVNYYAYSSFRWIKTYPGGSEGSPGYHISTKM